MSTHTSIKRRGNTLIGLILTITLLVLLIPSFVNVLIGQQPTNTTRETEAQSIVFQSFNALEAIQAQDFNQLQPGKYGLTTTQGYWSLAPKPDTINSTFTRNIIIEKTSNEQRKITILVTWQVQEKTETLQTELLLSNWT